MKKLKLPHRKAQVTVPVSPEVTQPELTADAADPTPVAVPSPSLASGWQLLKRSLREFNRHRKTYLLIVLVAAIPTTCVALLPNLAGNDGVQAWMMMLSILMNVALLSAMAAIAQGKGEPRLRQSYYDGITPLVRFVIVCIYLLLMTMPAAVGVIFYLLASYVPAGVLVTSLDWIIALLLGLVVSSASFWLLTRFGLSVFAVVEGGYAPMRALGYSWRLTAGRFWKTFGRLMFLVLLLLGSGVLLYLPVFGLGLVLPYEALLNAFFGLLTSLLLWPLFNIYLAELYRDLINNPLKR